MGWAARGERCRSSINGHRERPKLSDPALEGVRLQPGRDGRVRCSAWCVPSMGTVLMGLKSPVDKPDMTKTYS